MFSSSSEPSPNLTNIRIDANGDKRWDRSFGGNKRDVLTSIAPSPDGGFLLGGESESGVSGNKTSAGISGNKTAPNYGETDFWVLRLCLAFMPEMSYGERCERSRCDCRKN
jgi:hypothetical protein